MIMFCKKCVIPNTKPNFYINDEGICTACLNHDKKNKLLSNRDLKSLKLNLKKIIKLNSYSKNKYDVVVPVSGGKDSLFQVIELKKITKKILAVCVDFGLRTKVGEENLSLIYEKLNVDLIKFSLKKETIKKLALYSLDKYGDPDLFNHPLIYNIPSFIAKSLNIKTVVYGEDPRIEYSNTKIYNLNSLINQKFNKNFFNNFVSHSNIDLINILNLLKINKNERNYFLYQKSFENIKILFLGNFCKWNSINNFKIAKKIGFKTSAITEGTYRNFVNVDEDWNRPHHYLKLLKFGYGRCSDHASEDIRLGILNRKDAIKLINKFEYQNLSPYYIKRISKYLNISQRKLLKMIEKFRNKKLWKLQNKKWVLKIPIS